MLRDGLALMLVRVAVRAVLRLLVLLLLHSYLLTIITMTFFLLWAFAAGIDWIIFVEHHIISLN